MNPETTTPLISIIMPAYNAARFLPEAVESVLQQTYRHWELILVDDASEDNTPQVLEPYLQDSRIRYCRVERLGSPAKVRNAALNLAQGEYLAFLDADDRYRPEALAELMGHLLSQRQDGPLRAVQGFFHCMNEDGVLLDRAERPIQNEQGEWVVPQHLQYSEEAVALGTISCQLPTLLLHRSVYDAIGGFDETLGATEDYEFFIRMLTHFGHEFSRVPVTVYDYRMYAASITRDASRSLLVLDCNLRILEKLFQSPLGQRHHYFESRNYMRMYQFMIRERLNMGRRGLAWMLYQKAMSDSHIALKEKLKSSSQLLVRMVLPSGLNHWISEWVARQKQLKSQKSTLKSALKSVQKNSKTVTEKSLLREASVGVDVGVGVTVV